MKEAAPDIVHEWLERAAAGDAESWRRLLEPHHARLRRMVAGRMDPRLQGRVDPSDVLQNAYLEATRQLKKYLDSGTLPFFLWLRALVGSQLARTHRQHLGTQQRDAGREVPLYEPAPDMSSAVAVLGISASAAGKRYIRALDRLRELLAEYPELLSGWKP
jgi:RNA polymerase sigma-70 factor (ECF subfamily)